MAKSVAQNGLAAKLGGKGQQAFNAHKDDETTISAGGDLPAGIENGVAKVVECKFDTYKEGDSKGEFYFRASAVVMAPVEFEGDKIEGRRTSIMEAVCDTPKATGKRRTLDDHLAWVLNEMRKMGVETSGLDYSNLEAAAAAIKEAGPFIRFRTWKGKPTEQYPNPRVTHEWRGVAAGFVPSADAGVVDNSGEPAVSDDAGGGAAVETASDAGGDEDLSALGQAAEAGDGAAMKRLTELATAAGINADEVPTWIELGDMLAGAGGGGAGAGEEEVNPGKDEIYYFVPKDSKDGKLVEGEVTAVFEASKKVNIRNLTDKIVHKSVAWSDLKTSK